MLLEVGNHINCIIFKNTEELFTYSFCFHCKAAFFHFTALKKYTIEKLAIIKPKVQIFQCKN
jgi:hypothetical protein